MCTLAGLPMILTGHPAPQSRLASTLTFRSRLITVPSYRRGRPQGQQQKGPASKKRRRRTGGGLYGLNSSRGNRGAGRMQYPSTPKTVPQWLNKSCSVPFIGTHRPLIAGGRAPGAGRLWVKARGSCLVGQGGRQSPQVVAGVGQVVVQILQQ